MTTNNKQNEQDLFLEVENVINRIRPYINQDGGEITLIDVKDGMVYVKLSGACDGCEMIEVTVYDGLEKLLLEYVPGIIGVVIVDNKEEEDEK